MCRFKELSDERAFDIILNESKVDSVPPLTPSPFADPDRFSSPKKVLRKRSSRLSAASNSSYGSPKNGAQETLGAENFEPSRVEQLFTLTEKNVEIYKRYCACFHTTYFFT